MIGSEAGKMALYQLTLDNKNLLLTEWVKEQIAAISRLGIIKEAELRQQCATFLSLFTVATKDGNTTNLQAPEWVAVQKFLAEVSSSRGEQGFSPSETATFIFSFKRPLFTVLGQAFENDGKQLASTIWEATAILDKLGL